MGVRALLLVTIFVSSFPRNAHSKGRSCAAGNVPDLSNAEALQEYLQCSLQCNEWEVMIQLSACRVDNLGLQSIEGIFISNDPEANYATLSENCKFELVNDSYYGDIYVANLKFDECDAVVQAPIENFNAYQYRMNFKLGGFADGTISRGNTGSLDFSCFYNMAPSLFLGQMNPKAVAYIVSDAISGQPATNFTIAAYSDRELKNKLSASDPFVTMPGFFYIGAKLAGGGRSLILQADKCWATPTPSPTNKKKKNLISKGCPASTLGESGDVEVVENYQSSKVIIGVRVFLWPGFTIGQEIFVHCTLNICDTTVPDNACTDKVCGKRKRSLAEEKHYDAVDDDDPNSEPAFAISIGIDASGCAQSLCQDICTIIDKTQVCMCDTGRVLHEDGFSCEFEEQPAKPTTSLASVIIEDVSRNEFDELKLAAAVVGGVALLISLSYAVYFYWQASTTGSAKLQDFLPSDEKC